MTCQVLLALPNYRPPNASADCASSLQRGHLAALKRTSAIVSVRIFWYGVICLDEYLEGRIYTALGA